MIELSNRGTERSNGTVKLRHLALRQPQYSAIETLHEFSIWSLAVSALSQLGKALSAVHLISIERSPVSVRHASMARRFQQRKG